MARALVIGPEQEQAIAALKEKAAARVMSFETTQRLARALKEGRVTGNLNQDMTIAIPMGFRATYTHEEQRPGLVCRHLSVSVQASRKGPHLAAMQAIMDAFGFRNRLGAIPAWTEDLGRGDFAVNVVEPLDGDLTKLEKPVEGTTEV
jgi:hypothetical protein